MFTRELQAETIEIMKIKSEIIIEFPCSNMTIIVWENKLLRSCTLHVRENIITVCK